MNPSQLLSAVVVLLSLALPAPAATIYHSGKVWTGPGEFAEAFCVDGGRFAAVGTHESVKAACPGAASNNLGGAVVVPGLRDVHQHIGTAPGFKANHEDDVVSGKADPDTAQVCELAKAARKKVGLTNPQAIVVIASEKAFRARKPDGSPVLDIDFLDRCIGKWPLIVTHVYGHGKVINSAADFLLGVSKSAPVDWGWIETNKEGKFNGRIREGKELELFNKAFERVYSQDLAKTYVKFADFAARRGLTFVGEMATGMGHRKLIEALSFANEKLGSKAIHWEAICMPLRPEDQCLHIPQDNKDYQQLMVTTGGVKYFADSEWLSQSSPLSLPYVGQSTLSGRLNYTREQLAVRVRPLLERPVGMESKLHIHATTDKAVELVLAVLDETGGPAVWRPRRVTIEHAHVVSPAMLARLAEYGVSVTITGNHLAIQEGGKPIIFNRIPAALLPHTERLKSFRSAGINLAAGADAFDAPDANKDETPHNPWLNIALLMTHPGRPEEKLSLDEALLAYTKGAAWASFAEHRTGSIAKGLEADFAVLTLDPWKTPPHKFASIRSRLTVIGGRVAWDARAP